MLPRGQVGEDFSFSLEASPNILSYSNPGNNLSGVVGLSLDPVSGEITGTPTQSGDFDIVVEASNSSGSVSQVLRLLILPPKDTGTGPSINLTSLNGADPATQPVFDADTETIEIVADVTPDPGEIIEAVFVRWINPPAIAGQRELIVAELTPEDPVPATGPIEFSGTADVGFFPNDRLVGGGAIRLEGVATQRDANDQLSFGLSDTETLEIAPLVEILFPSALATSDGVAVGDLFASARVSTNAFAQVAATISGVGVFDTVFDDDLTDNPNGVFNFAAETAITVEGTYRLDIVATDTIGNETRRTLEFDVSESPGQPLVRMISPNPGFRNPTFTPAAFTYSRIGAPEFERNDDGDITSTTFTYALEQVTEGQGYFPRDADDQNLPFNFSNVDPDLSGGAGISGITTLGGKIPELPDTVSITFAGVSLGFGNEGNGLVDSRFDPGAPGRVDLSAEFVQANAPLESFRVFVNGEDVTPGTGNLNPANGPIQVPSIAYPAVGAPAPGDYVVVFQVTDGDGEVGVSEPLQFTIAASQELAIELSREEEGAIRQGETATYFVDVDTIDQVASVELFDSVSGESLGEAARVEGDAGPRFRFSRVFNEAGIFSVFAEVTTLQDQIIPTNPITVEVLTVNDLTALITNPEAPAPGEPDRLELFRGQSVTFAASASSTAGVASFDWIVATGEAVVEETDEAAPFSFTRIFDSVGTFFVSGRATDNFENVAETRQIEVVVREPVLSVDITQPSGPISIVAGTSLSFEAEIQSELPVASLTWSVNGVEAETDTSAPFALDRTFATPGDSTVTAQATDNLGTVADASVTVNVRVPNPLTTKEAFVSDSFSRISGRLPSQEELDEALQQLDGSVESRAAYLEGILRSDLTESTNFIQVVYRTMLGEWPDAQALVESREVLTNEVANTTSESGSIGPGETQNFNFELAQGNSVTVRAAGDGSNGNPLTDPTLTVTDPGGNLVGFADDSFLGGSFSLNPSISFVAANSGSFTVTVGGFSFFQSGDFTLTVQSSGSGVSGTPQAAQALVEFLIPEYEARFGSFLRSAAGSSEVGAFVEQVFVNKHGVGPSANALNRLGSALLGDSAPFNGETTPGYQGNGAGLCRCFCHRQR